MALFTLAELQAKATGSVVGITSDQYDRAHDFAVAEIISHTRLRYEDADVTISKVLKQIGLTLGLFHAGRERYNEQSNPGANEFWALRDGAVEALKAIRKGEQTADAASVETSRNDLEFTTRRDVNGNVLLPKFTDREMRDW